MRRGRTLAKGGRACSLTVTLRAGKVELGSGALVETMMVARGLAGSLSSWPDAIRVSLIAPSGSRLLYSSDGPRETAHTNGERLGGRWRADHGEFCASRRRQGNPGLRKKSVAGIFLIEFDGDSVKR